MDAVGSSFPDPQTPPSAIPALSVPFVECLLDERKDSPCFLLDRPCCIVEGNQRFVSGVAFTSRPQPRRDVASTIASSS